MLAFSGKEMLTPTLVSTAKAMPPIFFYTCQNKSPFFLEYKEKSLSEPMRPVDTYLSNFFQGFLQL